MLNRADADLRRARGQFGPLSRCIRIKPRRIARRVSSLRSCAPDNLRVWSQRTYEEVVVRHFFGCSSVLFDAPRGDPPCSSRSPGDLRPVPPSRSSSRCSGRGCSQARGLPGDGLNFQFRFTLQLYNPARPLFRYFATVRHRFSRPTKMKLGNAWHSARSILAC